MRKMRFHSLLSCTSWLVLAASACSTQQAAREQAPTDIKTTFQTSREWRPTIDNRADAVMVYGVGGNPTDKDGGKTSLESRLASWQERGYVTHFMTGIAWGSYQDYFTGGWDGKMHLDEGQVSRQGDTIWHGHMVPYIVPSENYLRYFKEKHIKRVIDAGVDAIFLEEPEFWARAGYSEAFKKEWKEYYGTPWRPQDESPEATYLSSKLKYHLYYRALNEAFTYAKEYGKSLGREIKCYVPTHSLLNYSQWQIVSPEASLASLPCVDGYIAQVWTGTSREPDYFNGVRKERVFETAYLEYGCMRSMTAPTGRKVWFLTDPIEDLPRDWEDYRRNYQATFTAQLLYPDIDSYEIMPWPERIYEGLYKKSADSDEKIRIPKDYSTMMQIMIGALNDIRKSDSKLSGSQGISVLMGNSLMFQRFPLHDGYDDPQLSNFYGLALPLLKRGIPIGISHIENLGYKEALEDVKILLMTYSNMKPLDPKAHEYLADWVKGGGVLIFSGRDDDPFQSVQEWWNTEGYSFTAPSDHLFSLMGIEAGSPEGEYSYGKGTVHILRHDPKEYVLVPGGDRQLLETVSALYENATKGEKLELKNNFTLERGPYTLAAVLDESVSTDPHVLKGCYIDLYDPTLPVLSEKRIEPGTQSLLYDVSKAGKAPEIIAAASKAYDIKSGRHSFSFTAKSPSETINVSRILLPRKPKSVSVDGKDVLGEISWDEASKTCLLKFSNNPDGIEVNISW